MRLHCLVPFQLGDGGGGQPAASERRRAWALSTGTQAKTRPTSRACPPKACYCCRCVCCWCLLLVLQVIVNGSQSMHAVSDSGVSVSSPDGQEVLHLHSWDASLVSPGTPTPFPNGFKPPDMTQGLHVNLANNVWGTNYVSAVKTLVSSTHHTQAGP